MGERVRGSVGWLLAALVLAGVACAEGETPAGKGGNAGAYAAAGGGGEAEAGAGGKAGAALGGSTGAGVGGKGGAAAGVGGKGTAEAGVSGKAGTAGNAGGEAGAGGEPAAGVGGKAGAGHDGGDSGWAEACDGVTMLGHCVGEVYEWCDYFARGLKRIDCGARGMTCRAQPRPLGSDYENAGCVTDSCTSAEEGCDGTLASQCSPSGLILFDCTKVYGPEGTCAPGQLGAGSCMSPYCEPERVVRCDGTVAVICALDHNFYIVDCAGDTGGTCEPEEDGALVCGDKGFIYP